MILSHAYTIDHPTKQEIPIDGPFTNQLAKVFRKHTTIIMGDFNYPNMN